MNRALMAREAGVTNPSHAASSGSEVADGLRAASASCLARGCASGTLQSGGKSCVASSSSGAMDGSGACGAAGAASAAVRRAAKIARRSGDAGMAILECGRWSEHGPGLPPRDRVAPPGESRSPRRRASRAPRTPRIGRRRPCDYEGLEQPNLVRWGFPAPGSTIGSSPAARGDPRSAAHPPEVSRMAGLTKEACVPCRGGVPTLSDEEIAALKPQVPEWQVAEVDGIQRIRREYRFKDFRQAMDFAVQVGELAEREQHHPDLHLAWGKVVVETWTHKIEGLHQNDFILAAKCDELFAGRAS